MIERKEYIQILNKWRDHDGIKQQYVLDWLME